MRTVRRLILVIVLAGIFWRFPLVHFVPLKAAEQKKIAATFNATQFASDFWDNRLLPGLDQSVKASVLLPAIQADAAAAKKQFARSVGLGTDYFYFLSGTGRVVAISDDAISLTVMEGSTNADIALQTGLVFGDAIRDGTGLLNVNDYPNSQDFNDISSALDHLVETRVLPALKAQAKVGAEITFAGCAEIDDEDTDLKPLKVIPIRVNLQSPP
jgi:predicted lipoprotein